MTYQAIVRFTPAAVAFFATALVFADVSRPPVPHAPAAGSARWESLRLNPKLIGFDAFTPDAPPRKFRRKVATGTMYFAFWSAALPPGGACEQYRDEWRDTEEFAPHDYTGRAFAENADASRRYREMSSAFPLKSGGTLVEAPDTDWYDGLTNLPPDANPPTASHRKIIGKGVAAPLTTPPGYGKAQGEYDEELSIEDTENDAIKRVEAQLALPADQRAPGAVETGAEPVAYFTRRTTTTGWIIQRTRYLATFQVSGTGQSTFRVDYQVGSEKRQETFTVANAAPGTLTVIIDATPQPYPSLFEAAAPSDYSLKVDQPDQEYRIEAVRLIEK